jgi:hypothetical protein
MQYVGLYCARMILLRITVLIIRAYLLADLQYVGFSHELIYMQYVGLYCARMILLRITVLIIRAYLHAVCWIFTRAYLHAVCWIFTMQTIDNILNNSGLIALFLSGDIHEGIYI